MNNHWLIGFIFRPIAALVLMLLIVYPIKLLCWKLIPAGKLKTALFRRFE